MTMMDDERLRQALLDALQLQSTCQDVMKAKVWTAIVPFICVVSAHLIWGGGGDQAGLDWGAKRGLHQ